MSNSKPKYLARVNYYQQSDIYLAADDEDKFVDQIDYFLCDCLGMPGGPLSITVLAVDRQPQNDNPQDWPVHVELGRVHDKEHLLSEIEGWDANDADVDWDNDLLIPTIDARWYQNYSNVYYPMEPDENLRHERFFAMSGYKEEIRNILSSGW